MRFPIQRNFRNATTVLALGAFLTLPSFFAFGQVPGRPPVGVPAVAPMKKASASLSRQDPPKISPRTLDKVTPDNAQVLVSLSKQRAYLMVNGEIAIDTPISSGKAAGMTPTGSFHVQEKDADHRSSVYGNFLDSKGRVVRAGVSTRIDSAPSGTHYEGASMKWFMRVSEGVGMHVGILPGYPASHGCVRMPVDIAPMFYQKVKVGTPVDIVH